MIVQNAVICNKCDDFIFSATVHDFRTCKCGNISVDGGQEYLRRVGGIDSYFDMSWSIENDIYRFCADAAQDAMDTGRNKFGVANAVLRALREKDIIVAEGEQRVMSYNPEFDEIMVVEPDGTLNRYKKLV